MKIGSATTGTLRGRDLAPWTLYCSEGKTSPVEVEWVVLGGISAATTIFKFRCQRAGCGLVHQQSVEMVVARMEQAWAKKQADGVAKGIESARGRVREQAVRVPPRGRVGGDRWQRRGNRLVPVLQGDTNGVRSEGGVT